MNVLQAYYNKGAKYVEAGTTYRFVEAVHLWKKNGRWCDYWGNPIDIHQYLEKEKPVEPKKKRRLKK